ncbi:hypothetical protein BV20DRAFT_296472 [Pilatotrama ljubarskyi]|nr:hypothetical protein BV20DRAFT_296472 [Pilatotrama ljubarskyi]
MRIAAPHHRVRQADNIPGFSGVATVSTAPEGTALAFDTAAASIQITGSAPPLVPGGQAITITSSSAATSTPLPTSSATVAADASSAASKSHQIPLGSVIAICVGAFIGVVAIICLAYAWFRRKTDKLSAAARRNAEGEAEQQRNRGKDFNKLRDSEKPKGGDAPPPSPGTREPILDSDEKNFSMFKKSPSIRTAYTTKTTTDEDQLMDLPKLDFTKYHPSLAQELALEHPDKPFAARQESGVSWDGETLGDDSFLSMRSVRVESGTMSPTMVMAKMTPPATASAIHRWESAEVLNADEEAAIAAQSRNPFAEMAEERRSRNNPFFNAQEMNRNSRAIRSRSNSRASRTSRAQSLVRPDSRVTMPNTNPFLELQESVPVSAMDSYTPDALSPNAGLPLKPSVASGTSAQAFGGNDRAMASLIAALDLSKEEVEERLRVVSMQGSTISAYSENDESDIATVREFPLPPGTTAHSP